MMNKKEFLDFCNNTSFIFEKYTEENILTIFDDFDKTKMNIYANIFNNLDRKEFIKFLNKYNIDNKKVINIYDLARKNGLYMIKYYIY